MFVIITLPNRCALRLAQFVDFPRRKCFQCTNKFGKTMFLWLHAWFGRLRARRGWFKTYYRCIATNRPVVNLYYRVKMVGHDNMFVQNDVVWCYLRITNANIQSCRITNPTQLRSWVTCSYLLFIRNGSTSLLSFHIFWNWDIGRGDVPKPISIVAAFMPLDVAQLLHPVPKSSSE